MSQCTTASSCAAGTGGSLRYVVAAFVTALLSSVLLLPLFWRFAGSTLGWWLQQKTSDRRRELLSMMESDEKAFQEEKIKNRGDKKKSNKSGGKTGGSNSHSDDDWENIDSHSGPSAANGEKAVADWDGIVGFFHPFCNAGGGGERVLWAAIRATQERWPHAKCVVYTGDRDAHKDDILARVRDRFNIHIHPPTVAFLYLHTRRWVLASTWPHFTLAGQSVGSVILAWEALSLLVPDIFVDTMGYAFALGCCKLLFARVPTGAYVHYPTISTDMLASLDPRSAVGSLGVNAGQGTGARGVAKRMYWQAFAWAYARVGASVDVVMTNSTWTQAHMKALWGPLRKQRLQRAAQASAVMSQKSGEDTDIAVVYPPVAVSELEEAVEVSAASEAKRERVLVYIAQFRPEKNHPLILQAFAQFVKKEEQDRKAGKTSLPPAKLVLIGSVRDDHDSKRVYQLRLQINELGIRDAVEFHLDAPWPAVLRWLQRASVGVNGMWNEHFGIGVVEYEAAGLVSVVHDSGGPKLDIVIPMAPPESEGCGGNEKKTKLPTGFHATTADEFAQAFSDALSLPDPLAWRERARRSAKRFTEEEFDRRWLAQMERLVAMAGDARTASE